jgi:hypothetical protein
MTVERTISFCASEKLLGMKNTSHFMYRADKTPQIASKEPFAAPGKERCFYQNYC